MTLAIIPGHISAVHARAHMVDRDGTRHTHMLAEVKTPEGTFVIPVENPDGLLDADVEITVRRLTP